jgi:hypothetical protein
LVTTSSAVPVAGRAEGVMAIDDAVSVPGAVKVSV